MTNIVGSKGGGKGGSGETPRVAVEAPDSLQSRQFARVLDLICEGEIEGLVDGLKSVYLDDTPIQSADGTMNFSGVTLDTRYGTQAQTYIKGFENQVTETIVNTEVTAAVSVTRSVTDVNANAVSVTLSVPSLTSQNTTNGDLSGTSVEIAIDIQASGGSFVTQNLGGQEVISGKTRSKYQRQYRLPLTGSAPWNIRVRRITAASPGAHIQNSTFWDSYSAIIEKKLTYPNTALVGLEIDSANFSSIPRRSYHMKLMRVRIPSNYNPTTRIYSGVWDGTFTVAYTNNPAWCFYDLVTSTRYGLGKYIPEAMQNKWYLYTIGQYCDGMVPDGKGGYEPRFTCNTFIASQVEAFRLLNDMASVFRGMVYWSSGSVFAVQDAPSTPVAIFNQTNVIGGMFYREGAARKARHTAAIIKWNDPDDFFRLRPEYVEDAEAIVKFGYRPVEAVAFACSSQGQANRVGKWLLFTEKYESEVISFVAGMDSAFLRPGQLALVVDPSRTTERLGGRVLTAAGTSIGIDAPVTIAPATTYTLSIVSADGAIVSRTLTNSSGSTSSLTFADALPSTDVVGNVWVLAKDNLEPETVRILAITEEGINHKIIAVQHYADKFDMIENGLVLQLPQTTNLKIKPEPVVGLAGSEYLYKSGGAVLTRLVISFNRSADAAFYDVYYRPIKGNFIKLPRTSSSHVEISDASNGQYELSVVAVSVAGVLSEPVEALYTVLGKEGINPSNVASLNYTIRPDGVYLDWPEIADLDRMDYEIRVGATYGADANPKFTASNTMRFPPLASGTYTFWVKARDSSFNLSATPASVTVVIPNPSAIVFSSNPAILGPDLRLEWSAPTSVFAIVGYIIKYGASFNLGTDLGTMLSTVYQRTANWGGSRTFWVGAVDSAGNIGAIGSKEVVINSPNSPGPVTAQVIDNNVILYWHDAERDLPIDSYIIKRGPVFGSAAEIGTKKGQFTSVMETEAGSYTYWVVGVDTAGNIGTEASVVTYVNNPPDYVLNVDHDSTLSGTLNNAVFVGGEVILPVNTTETFSQHFTTNSWTSPQAQVTAGFPVYIQPTVSSGYYEETLDYGQVLAGSKITVSANIDLINSPVVAYTISTKKLVGDPWVDVAGDQTYATDFRYVKVRITVTSSGSDDLATINALNIRLDSKLKTASTMLPMLSTDAAGTEVFFTDTWASGGVQAFIDVASIDVTPLGTTTPLSVVVEFTDVPSPVSFKIRVFNSTTGARVSTTVSITVRGF